jgi:hypothetical protein
MELKDKAVKLYADKKVFADVIDRLTDDLMKAGFVELENDLEGLYKVTSAFHYLEELVNCLNIVEGAENEIP